MSSQPPTSSPTGEPTSATDEKAAPANSAVTPKAPGTTVQKWADPAMFTAMPLSASEGPKVSLTQAPADPLGVIAQLAMAYEGRFVESLAEITDDERRRYLKDMQLTKLAMPLEGVLFVFSISGVTRGFTHQMVRQRTAAYSQESTRFAVIEDQFASRVALPPSLQGTKSLLEWDLEAAQEIDSLGKHWPTDTDRDEDIDLVRDQLVERYGSQADKWRYRWDKALLAVQDAYQGNVGTGMPAEDARGLLPTNITTRINYVTNLRGLLDHAGNRLCTQAQFEWRQVFAQIAQAIREYGEGPRGYSILDNQGRKKIVSSFWQFEELSKLFRPVCYQLGKCPMKASFDRSCKIRDRVDANATANRPSAEWHLPGGDDDIIPNTKPIFPAEWLLDPGAAR